jgi:excisionase family DNA binding protein
MKAREGRRASQPRRGLRLPEAAAYIGVGVTTFKRLLDERRMPAPKAVLGVRVWDIVDLDAAFDDLPSAGERENEWGNS